jgi:hypothetical protein
VREDGGHMLRAPQDRARSVDRRARQGNLTDEERCRTRVAARRDLATDQWWDRQGAWKPIRRANADSSRDLQTAAARRLGLPDFVFQADRSGNDSLSPASHSGAI